ncbi:MAG: UDP-4-amino-4,6-dideoxy-N-acetyl-beta-L-altrosamine transaminase [Nitrospirae bacterium CG18_big_fil_WC_8_21_14_2_50_70_55]|nr:DegT/DnrJ/EryC1/StrS family aminotransferase [Deltaproteobacteria bacterium]OIP66034.1 MAG: UDP-4-amino-4,6-dideoxy-N-acetyl-beta-L-altrosamine transaminase [Nitrospirae bacterium CG2_30_70_394]PIQ03408.1 MAG: UDP-4-amino-4,6-dideoxy-N-acetyl-beta-L-altrosamine transaminase [Nitrospirae bacterium CG18_big_fil_WC_8_21_14_2_50_70_55]PIU79682.1 MAG: UDP-4-amino-4,6-dideoxy-N-acetyl-beta-L-altrosamine transaminase [Nitrospirae bacterium CG06_land_8_20_14_3_00_70_43]PIW82964.1 MAG: UDP-4-amino-4,
MRDNFLVFGSPQVGAEEIQEVEAVLRSRWLGTGPRVARFEADFAAFKGVKASQVAAVNSCTAALHISMIAAGLGPGDEVITTALTFCATVNAIIHAGATPVLADIDPLTMNIDPLAVEQRISPRTRAIVPVHFAGRPCAMEGLTALAERHHLKIIEDCAHAVEATYRGAPVGTLGNFGCFSFYVTKNVVTGEGGMIVARAPEEIERARVLALHGMSKDAWHRFGDAGFKHYQVVECGFKYNMMDLQAAIGIHQLARVEANWQRRREIWEGYEAAFAPLGVTTPPPLPEDARHGLHLYTLLIDERRAGITRDAFLDAMTARKIGVGVHYLAIPEHPYYQGRFGWRPEEYPNATRVGRQTVSLPLSPALTSQDVNDVIAAVTEIVGGRRWV